MERQTGAPVALPPSLSSSSLHSRTPSRSSVTVSTPSPKQSIQGIEMLKLVFGGTELEVYVQALATGGFDSVETLRFIHRSCFPHHSLQFA